MKILLYIIILILTHVSSKDIENLDGKSYLYDVKSHNFGFSYPFLERSGAFSLIKKKSEDILKSDIQAHTKKDLYLTEDEEFLFGVLLTILKTRITLVSCSQTLVLLCPLLSLYPDLTGSLKKFLEEKCRDTSDSCEHLLKKFGLFCNKTKEKVQSIANKTDCNIYIKKCDSLLACKNGLDISCKEMKEKCKLLQDDIKNATANATEHDDTQKKPYGSQVVIDGTTLEVETAHYTHKKTLYGTKCSRDKSHTKCESTNTLATTSTCSLTMRETYSIETYSVVDQISSQTECSYTLTSTNKLGETFTKILTRTIISGDAHDKSRDMGDGTQTEKHRKLILFYMAIGIIAGTWIIV